MKKTALFFCMFMALMALCLPALADPFTGGSITVDVPGGWQASFKRSDPDQLILHSPQNQYRLAILPGPSNGMNSEQGAQMLARMVEGSKPLPASKHPNMYTFTTHSSTLRCMVVARGERMVAILESGNSLPFELDIASIVRSLTSTDADEQAIFDSLKPLYP